MKLKLTCSQQTKLVALQLNTDHSTSIEDEVTRIKNEHPDDMHCIVNDRVKGRLKVTIAFGAGFLKQVRLNIKIPKKNYYIISVFITKDKLDFGHKNMNGVS
ncbi:hypothetical protein N665_0201s0031 [Sinapis alba]|nr:hypothetical protein N665_0201s0031 [Sinapis alba]